MKKEKLTRNIVWIAISAVTALTAVLLIIQVLRLYFGNKDSNPIYTRGRVGEYLLPILFSMILWVLLVTVGGVLSYKFKLSDNKNAKHGKKFILNNLLRMIPTDEVEDDPDYLAIKKEDKKRKIGWLITLILIAICALFVILYVFNKKHYSLDMTGKILQMLSYVHPFIIMGFVFAFAMSYYEEYSANNSIIYAKKLLAKYKKQPISYEAESIKKRNFLIGIKSAILVLAIVLIITGICNGGATSVLGKAANLCKECVGIG